VRFDTKLQFYLMEMLMMKLYWLCSLVPEIFPSALNGASIILYVSR
jgi:hypothetical protein